MRNRTKITEAGGYLLDRSDKFSVELNENITSGKATLGRHTLLVRKNATGAAASWPLIDSKTQETVGVSTNSGMSDSKYYGLRVEDNEISLKAFKNFFLSR